MRKTLCALLLLFAFAAGLGAQTFQTGTAYYFVSEYFGEGYMGLGSYHGVTPEIYHTESGSFATADDAAWYVEKSGTGYTIQSAATGQYLAYTTTRDGNRIKYLELVDAVTDNNGRWTFAYDSQYDCYTIQNVADNTQWFNVRTDGTNLVGTYNAHYDGGSVNEQFKIYTKDGQSISGNSSTDPVDNTVKTEAESLLAANIWGLQELYGVTDASKIDCHLSDALEGNIPALIDNDYSTFHHSDWHGTTSDAHYMVYELAASTRAIRFYIKQRNSANPGRPLDITVAGSNNGVDFTDVAELTGLTWDGTPLDMYSPLVQGAEAYKYWRFTVYRTNSTSYTTVGDQNHWFCASEWYVMPANTLVDNFFAAAGQLRAATSEADIQAAAEAVSAAAAAVQGEMGNELVKVTYQLWEDGKLINTVETYQPKNSAVAVPAAFTQNATGYFFTTEGTIGEEDCTIVVTRIKGDGELSAYLLGLQFNRKKPVYDEKNSRYLFTLPESLRGGDKTFTALVNFTARQDGISVRINGSSAADGEELTIDDVQGGEAYTLEVLKDGTPVSGVTLVFTYLPIVEVNVASCNSSTYTQGTFHVLDGDLDEDDAVYTAKFKYRGATASHYDKKAYAVKMITADGSKIDRTFLGMRTDNSWILDAMAIDKADMRNRVSTDLWNDFSHAPYHAQFESKPVYTGTHGRFVEMFLNGEYRGLYCFTEKLDRKQLRLEQFDTDALTGEQTVRGTLYKTTSWGYEVFMGHNNDTQSYPRTAPTAYDNYAKQETWCSYEVKYPDYESEPIDWAPLWRAVNVVAAGSDQVFADSFNIYFDRPVVTDYYLFIELMLATDNHGKNMFYYNYDTNPGAKKLAKGYNDQRKLGIAVWDLDGTWGRRWDGTNTWTTQEWNSTGGGGGGGWGGGGWGGWTTVTHGCGAEQDFDDFLWENEHGQLTYFTRLRENTAMGWEAELTNRYKELRRTWFTPESLCARFTDYLALFNESGAAAREESTWTSYHSSISISGDVDYITDWIRTRVAYLDKSYGFSEGTASFSVDAAGYAAYYNSRAFQVPDGLVAGIVTAATADSLSIDYRYGAGEVVPAGTAVILFGAAGSYTVRTFAALDGETAAEGNLLRGADSRARTTGGTYYFKLSQTADDEQVGFYSQTAAHGAFYAPAHEAYLALTADVSTDFIPLNLSVETAISDVTLDTLGALTGTAVFDLQGRRVAQPLPGGVYIVGGKKVRISLK
ncbi:MAG: CotH kinase family protein [Bacteroidaceae bacterium]|nr:CotH kinase family protein [Bacteroidaceae bacterium]